MTAELVPILRVKNIEATIAWYENIGFECTGTSKDWSPDSEMNWAQLNWGEANFMLSPSEDENGGKQKDVSLYFKLDSLDGIYEAIKDKVKILEVAEDTEYGRNEISFEDLNGYLVSFSSETK